MNSTHRNPGFRVSYFPRIELLSLASAIVFALAMFLNPPAQAQTYKVIYKFTGGGDGANPTTGVTIDGSGHLYGTTLSSGGTIFRLSRSGPGWLFSTLYSFHGGNDGFSPSSRPLLALDGTLYGATQAGGGGNCGSGGCGAVYHLKPPPTALASWEETVIYSFSSNGRDDPIPFGDLAFDPAGNLSAPPQRAARTAQAQSMS